MRPRRLAEFPADEQGRRFQVCQDEHILHGGWSVKSMQFERLCVCPNQGFADLIRKTLDDAARDEATEGQ